MRVQVDADGADRAKRTSEISGKDAGVPPPPPMVAADGGGS